MNPLDDDFVASLLKSEAKAKASDYSSRGLQAFLPSRPTSGAPKPNTRFLRNLVRDVDSHNAALREQEALNKSSRFRSNSTTRHQTDRREFGRHERHVRERDRAKRRRTRSPASPGRDGKYRRGRSRSASPSHHRSSHRRIDHKSHRSRRKEGSPRRDEERYRAERYERKRRSKERSGSPHRESKSKKEEKRPGHKMRTGTCERGASTDYDDSSDPLEDIVGPLPPPPPRSRGRGAVGKSNMDQRFKDDYDPSVDVQPNSDEDAEWDNAVEAFRDRVKWKQQGAERLRSAGFDDEFITAWENNAIEDESKLKWTQKGAMREWDRGKVVDEETGTVELKAQWARGKVG